MVVLCDFHLLDFDEVLPNLLCILYALFALASFVLGVMVSLVGLQNARKKIGKSGTFYKIMLWVYLAGFIAVIYTKFFR